MSIKKSNTNEITNIVIDNEDLIDQAIFKSEREVSLGAKPVDAELVFQELEKKYFG